MLNKEGHRIEIEEFIEEVMEAQEDERTRGFTIELDDKYTIMADEIRLEDDVIFALNGDDIVFIPEYCFYDMSYVIVSNDHSGNLIIALAQI